jgi:trehalose-6-phosphate synthase
MKFTLDFEITQELEKKFGDDLRKQAHAKFCISFFEQIKDKLNYSCVKMKAKKQKLAFESSIDSKAKNVDEKVYKIQNVDVDVYRISIDMPSIRIKTECSAAAIKRKPKHSFNIKESGEKDA